MSDLRIYSTTAVSSLCAKNENKFVRLYGFVETLRHTRNVTFMTLRESLDTVQLIVSVRDADESLCKTVKELSLESFIEVCGEVREAHSPIRSCTNQDLEIDVVSVKTLGPVTKTLPFSIKDASASDSDREKNPSVCNVNYGLRMDYRFLDFRVPSTTAIIHVLDGAMAAFRSFLRKNRFIEMKTTKIIQSGSEGGANLFSLNYFGNQAFLAQSPQLYKQMAVVGGLQRIYEIGHVYRAEQSNVNRYLSEFTGVDIEMEQFGDYLDTVRFIYSMLVHVFDTLKEEYAREIEIIRSYRPFEDIKFGKEPIIITHRDAITMLREGGSDVQYDEDLSREMEKQLGNFMKKKHDVDIFVVIEYPANCRAFYTHVDPETGRSSSFDVILRGEEVLSGARRETNPMALKKAVEDRGMDPEALSFYLDCFNYGAPPHAGCGIGFERLLKSYFNFDDIRYFALFPRDPNRIYP